MPYVHGMARTRLYKIWVGMIARCENETCHAYERYGGRGIKVCAEWHDFVNFYHDMGDRPKGMTLDRIDNDGDYCPENCRWATWVEQNNNKNNNRLIVFNGETKSLSEWARILGCSPCALKARIEAGWELSEALTKPLRNKKEHNYNILFNGEEKTIREWAEIVGIRYDTLRSRFRRGWTVEMALGTPLV